MPYLLLPPAPAPAEQGESSYCTLLSLPLDSQIDCIAPLRELRGKWFVGSQDSWIATLDELCNPALLNPFTRAHIPLPPITATSGLIDPIYDPDDATGTLTGYTFHYCRDIRNNRHNGPFTCTFDQVRHDSFRKVVLSSSPTLDTSFVAAAIFNLSRVLLAARAGEDRWTILDEHGYFEDVIYVQTQFLAVGVHGELKAVTIPPSVQVKHLAKGFNAVHDGYHAQRYLVDSTAGLLQVCRYTDMSDDSMFKLGDIVIMKLDTAAEAEAEEAMWVPVKSLGDHSLFVGCCYSQSISVRDLPGLKPNCIYFTDDAWDIFASEEGQSMVRDVGIYSLEDESVEFIYPPDSCPRWPAPIWITPAV